jgi:hypothetical protein
MIRQIVKKWWVWAIIAAALLSFPIGFWVRTEMCVSGFIENPKKELSISEYLVIWDYLQGKRLRRMWRIPSNRQKALVNSTLEYNLRFPNMGLLLEIRRQWSKSDGFETLPTAVNAVIRRGEPRTSFILCEVVPDENARSIEDCLDVDYVMLHSKDELLIGTCFTLLKMDTLLKHRGSCLAMLRRGDVGPNPKIRMLKSVINVDASSSWFGDGSVLLLEMSRNSNSDLANLAESIHNRVNSGFAGSDSNVIQRIDDSGSPSFNR